MNIDNETGLPELPESYFWRVNPFHVEIRKREPDSDVPEVSYRTWWGRKKIVSPESVISGRSSRICVGGLARNPDYPPPKITDYGSVYLGNAVPVTRANVLEMAEVAMVEYHRRDLFGDYPPKRLKDES